MKSIVFIIFSTIALILTGTIQPYVNVIEASDTIKYWGDNSKLSWNDFQYIDADVNNNSEYAGIITYIIKNFEFAEFNFNYEIIAVMNPEKSWTLDTSNILLLQHEQLHFDITELYARLIRKKLENLKTDYHISESQDILDAANSLDEEWKKYHELYDSETSHGTNPDKQIEWNKKILSKLNDLKEYQVDYTD